MQHEIWSFTCAEEQNQNWATGRQQLRVLFCKIKIKSYLGPFGICVTLSHLFNLSEALHFSCIKSLRASVSAQSAFGFLGVLDTLKNLPSHNCDYAGYCQVNLRIWAVFLSWYQWRYSPASSSATTHFSEDQFQTLTQLKVNSTHFFMVIEPICKQHGGLSTLLFNCMSFINF